MATCAVSYVFLQNKSFYYHISHCGYVIAKITSKHMELFFAMCNIVI